MLRSLPTVFILLVLGACSTQQPIHNVADAMVPPRGDGSLLTLAEVKSAIVDAAKFKRWRPLPLDQDTIEAEITVRSRHTAKVHIDYSQLSYSITLQSTSGLDEKNGKIHRNYNKWIMLLDDEIQDRLNAIAIQ